MRSLQGSREVDKGQVHQRMMVIVWLLASNIGLWTQAFKHYQWASYFHLYSMGIVTIITWMSGFMAIIEFGVPAPIGDFHVGLGLTIMTLLILQCLGGIVSWSLQSISRTAPLKVGLANLLHRIFGWILLLLTMIQLLVPTKYNEPNLFTAIIIIDLVSYILFIALKVFRKRLQGYSQIQSEDINGVPVIKSLEELAKYHGNYFIFADKIYNISNVITNHPGGYELIHSIRGREVDRFLYGSEPIETVQQMRVHSHSAASITMAGQPIAFLASICPFQNMEQINDVELQRCVLPCKSAHIYAPYLKAKSQQFVYGGYSDLSQIGKYYALTILDKKTRLYTLVNFLHVSNLQLMSHITGRNFFPKATQSHNTLNQSLSTEMVSTEQKLTINSIPLLIKKYVNGDFTQTFLSQNFGGQIRISKPRGKGMSLNTLPNGRIILLAGGTGLHPYCDLIDLLYKEALVSENNANSNQILAKNPLVKKKCLMEKFKFSLYFAVKDTDDIHEITAYQLNYLSKSKRLEVFFRANHRSDEFIKSYPDLPAIGQRFDDYVPELAQQLESISQIYMCGPPSMTRSLYKCFGEYNISDNKFTTL